MSKIITFSGKEVDLLNPDLSILTVEDIAHSLSQINRFVGHTKYPYSVAQHCVNVSYLAQTKEEQKQALFHDAAECLINDIATPVKYMTGLDSYRVLDKMWTALILQKFTGNSLCSADIKKFDNIALYCESYTLNRYLFKSFNIPPKSYFDKEYSEIPKFTFDDVLSNSRLLTLEELSWTAAKDLYLNRYCEIFEMPFDSIINF